MRTINKLFKRMFSLVILLLVIITALPWQFAGARAGSRNLHDQEPYGKDEAGWDTFFAREMANYGVYGAIMVVVENGQVTLEKGYGYADAASQMPMDPGSTILRAGSIAKTVTALAVLQLAEDGRLDLDADVNDYLTAFKLPDTFAEPVTARHLINMTAGFDTRWVGIRAASQEELLPLGEYLKRHMPARVLPPGKVRRYNDHELALAGYLVEVISGMPYEDYVRQKIFGPLEMDQSSFLLPDDQLETAARGYPVGAGPEQPYPFSYYYLQDAPGSGFNTTGQDMSHLMLAHMQEGSYLRGDGSRVQVLQVDSMQAMHQTAFRYHPKLAGQVNSFDEEFFNGHRYLRKTGGAPGMNNAWLILPDQDVSLYLFYNSDGYALRNEWQKEVLGRYLSVPDDRSARYQPDAHPPVDVYRYEGYYRKLSDETSETTIVKIKSLVDPDLSARVNSGANGGLQVWGRAYTPVDQDLFLGSGSTDLIYFTGDAGQPAEYLYQARTAYQRVAWLERPVVQYILVGFSLLVFVMTVLTSIARMLQRKASGYRLAGLIAGIHLVFLTGLIWILLPVATGGDVWQFSFAPSLELRLVLALPLVTLPLAAWLLYKTVFPWQGRSVSTVQRLFNSLVLIGTAAWFVFLHTWNLLGWRF